MLGETIGTINFTTASTSAYLITRTISQAGGNITEQPNVVITHIHLISNGSGASNLLIYNGSGGTQQINITGTTSKGIDFDFGVWGITFPSGAYITSDGNLANAAITCKAAKI